MLGSKLLFRSAQAAFGEVETLLSRRALVNAAGALPAQSFSRMRTALLRAAGVVIGEHSLIQGPLRITGDGNPSHLLSIGAYTIISGPLHVDIGAAVQIGWCVRIGHDVSLLTVSHELGDKTLRSGTRIFAPITIGNGVWLASRTTVLPGVTIGDGAVVAAGAVVTRDVAPNTLVAGVPARLVRVIDDPERASLLP
jgi:acetyltransferase-like isoleucine patch superfamily enzyme